MDHPAGHAVRGEEQRDVGTDLFPEFLAKRDEFVGEGLSEQRMLGPSVNELNMDGVACFCEGCASIEPDACARVLRSETDGSRRSNSIRAHLLLNVRDIGLPVAHADVDRQV